MDREKIIKGLECCTFILGKRKCNECPYQKGLPDNGCYQLQDDFHALLKEQEAEIIATDYVDGFGNRISHCPSCNSRLEWHQNKNYCGECGQAVKWE